MSGRRRVERGRPAAAAPAGIVAVSAWSASSPPPSQIPARVRPATATRDGGPGAARLGRSMALPCPRYFGRFWALARFWRTSFAPLLRPVRPSPDPAPRQVSKTPPTGEYVAAGAFIIRGAKNYLPVAPAALAFGFLFRAAPAPAVVAPSETKAADNGEAPGAGSGCSGHGARAEDERSAGVASEGEDATCAVSGGEGYGRLRPDRVAAVVDEEAAARGGAPQSNGCIAEAGALSTESLEQVCGPCGRLLSARALGECTMRLVARGLSCSRLRPLPLSLRCFAFAVPLPVRASRHVASSSRRLCMLRASLVCERWCVRSPVLLSVRFSVTSCARTME